MKNTFYIAQRELYAYFATPIAYVIMATFLLFSGLIFHLFLSNGIADANTTMRNWFGYQFFVTGLLIMLFGSVLTTRLLAEELRTGTLELLLTSPIRNWQVVIGKFLATVVLYIVLLFLTLYYVLLLVLLGGQVDIGPLVSGYLGLLLLGSVFFSIGLFASALTESQVIAAVIAIILSFVLYVAGPLLVQSSTGPLQDFVNSISLGGHADSLASGVIDLRDILLYASVIGFFLFVTTRLVASRRLS
jgi:ABC-2 type transport system permease protein